MLRRSPLVECVSVLPGNRCLQNVEIFILRQYVQQCLLKNPKYTFYTIKSSLKLAYKSLHQSFFYSFITILPSESGVTLHYSTILPWILLFCHLTSIFESKYKLEFALGIIQSRRSGCAIVLFLATRYFPCRIR